MHDRTPWTRGPAGPKEIKGRIYKKLIEFSRPCASCGQPFSIFVTEKIAAGHADSNSFGLRNCERHRRNKTAQDAAEVETLRTYSTTVKDELAGLYAENKALRERLALYELPQAMQAVANDTAPPTTDSPLPHKMPWE